MIITIVPNAWRTVASSLAVWAAQIAGWMMLAFGYVQTSAERIQTALHFDQWQLWVPFLSGFIAVVAVPILRSISQGLTDPSGDKPADITLKPGDTATIKGGT